MDLITPKQLEDLREELAEYPDIEEIILEGTHIRALWQLPYDKYHVVILRIRQITNSRNGIK
jgi:hypothetical protein